MWQWSATLCDSLVQLLYDIYFPNQSTTILIVTRYDCIQGAGGRFILSQISISVSQFIYGFDLPGQSFYLNWTLTELEQKNLVTN